MVLFCSCAGGTLPEISSPPQTSSAGPFPWTPIFTLQVLICPWLVLILIFSIAPREVSPEDPVADRRPESIQDPFQSCPREQPLAHLLIHQCFGDTTASRGQGIQCPPLLARLTMNSGKAMCKDRKTKMVLEVKQMKWGWSPRWSPQEHSSMLRSRWPSLPTISKELVVSLNLSYGHGTKRHGGDPGDRQRADLPGIIAGVGNAAAGVESGL